MTEKLKITTQLFFCKNILQHKFSKFEMYSKSILKKKTMIYMTTFFISLVITIVTLSIAIFMSMWPRILDIIKPKNESRSDSLKFIMTEYFIDEEKYFYLSLIHMNVALCIGATTMIATGTILIGYCKYVCGMFKIAR